MDRADISPQTARRGALLAVLPFVGFALASLVFILLWAPDPRWGLVVIPPFIFMIALTWLAFSRVR